MFNNVSLNLRLNLTWINGIETFHSIKQLYFKYSHLKQMTLLCSVFTKLKQLYAFFITHTKTKSLYAFIRWHNSTFLKMLWNKSCVRCYGNVLAYLDKRCGDIYTDTKSVTKTMTINEREDFFCLRAIKRSVTK